MLTALRDLPQAHELFNYRFADGSLAPALLVDGIGSALAETSAPVVYLSNLVTKPRQTDGFTVTDFADEIERFAGEKFLDFVVYNRQPPQEELLEKYAKAGEKAVEIGDVRWVRPFD